MSIYVPSLREKLQELREENSEMWKEIDLVEQRDNAMKQNERVAKVVQEKAAELRESVNKLAGMANYWQARYMELEAKMRNKK